ncbi:hypothetical protein JXJ21_06610 [candidate division KSB1 bacterium]|nr:hypothetical protein [candidate division KSB1 bacterium]
MILERLFTSAGSKIDTAILKNLSSQIKAKIEEEQPKEEMTQKELKAYQRRVEKKTEKIRGILGKQIKQFAELIDKQRYHRAIIELYDARNAVEELEQNADYHALLSLCYVAVLKYDLADSEERFARKLKTNWVIFDDIVDNVYESGKFFIADQLDESPKKLKLSLNLKEDLKWDDVNTVETIEELSTILEQTDESSWRSLKKEKPDLNLDEQATVDDLIVQLCDQFILPFYARLELKKLTAAFK